MKKKGFTLIELLAVIVVLAIIALIATPIVMNTIKKSQKGAAERSADNYIEAVETAVATSRLDSDGVQDGTYTVNNEGNIEGNGLEKPLTIEMSGNKPSGGTITIKNGQVETSSTMTIGSYEVAYNPTNKKYEAKEKNSTSLNFVYRRSSDKIKIGDTIDLSNTSKFKKDASTLGKSYYLKHILDKDNKVTESYACVYLKGKEYCLTNGEYGYAENEADYTGNALILKNLRDAKIEGIGCSFSNLYANCYDDSSITPNLRAKANGSVVVIYRDSTCDVYVDGSSDCDIW